MDDLLSEPATHLGSERPCEDPPRGARIAVAILFFMNGALVASWVSRIPAVQQAHRLSHSMLGWLLLEVALGALIAMPLSGWCASRFGSRVTSQVTAILFCSSVPWLAAAPSPLLLGIALFLFGAFSGALDVAMNAQAVAVEIRYQRPIMSSFHALFSLGGLAGASAGAFAAAAQVRPFAHFTAATALLGGITIGLALPQLLLTSEAVQHQTAPAPATSNRRFIRPPAALLALGAVAFCVMLGEGAMADWSAIFLKNVALSPESVAAMGYGAFSIAMALGRIFGDSLTARLGPVTLVRGGSIVAAAGVALAILWPRPLIVLAGFAAVGAGLATIVPLIFSAAGRTHGMAAGPALAITTTLGYTGFLVGPPLIGVAADHIGLRSALGFLIVAAAVGLALAPSLRKV